MSLLKAFACQVILLGTYKLFLEHIFEDYLVPDELTRNCLVGFVCLLCFGIQLYTDKAADDDIDEAGEDLKAASNSREAVSTKKYESAEISVTLETIGSNTSNQGMVTKTETTSQKAEPASFSTARDQRVIDSKENISAVPNFDIEKAPSVTNAGIFSQFSANMPDTSPNVKTNEAEMSASNVQTSYKQETTTLSASNGLSQTIFCEESDEDEIEIDQFEAKEPVKVEAEPLGSTKDVEPCISEPVTDIASESECLASNGETISSTLDSETTILKTDESEAEMINGTVEDSLNNNKIDSISLNTIETESKESVKNGNEIGNRQEISSVSQSSESTNGFPEPLTSTKEVKNTISVLTKTVNAVEIPNKNNEETSTLVKSASSSTISKIKASGDVCVAPVTIDISFIYACH